MKRPEDEADKDALTEEDEETLEDLEKQGVPEKEPAD